MNTLLQRRARLAALVLLLTGAAGCSLGGTVGGLATDAGSGAVRGARGQLATDSTQAAIRLLTGTVVSGVTAGLRPAIDTTLSGVIGRARTFIGTTQDSLALFVGGPLSASVQRLLSANLRTLSASLDGQIDPLIAGVGRGLRAQLALTLDSAGTGARQVLIPLVGEAIDSASARLAVNGQGPLRQAIDSIVASAVRAGADAVDERSRPILNRITGALMGIAGVIVLGALAWMHIDRRRSRAALFAMAEAIRTTDDEQVRETIKDRVKQNARRRQIDGYLHTFLEKNHLLRGTERIPVPKLVGDDVPVASGAGEPRA